MNVFFLAMGCVNLAICVLCIKDSVASGAIVTAFGVAWCLANLLGWLA